MSLTPAQLQILVNFEPFRAAVARMLEAVNATGPQFQRLAETFERLRRADEHRATVHHIRTQYRRKSRGHR